LTLDKKIRVPVYLRENVKPMKRGYPKKINFMVFDTETESATTGRAYLLTFSDSEKCFSLPIPYEDIEYPSDTHYENGKVEKKNVTSSPITRIFFETLRKKTRRKYVNVLFAHNLWFDLSAVLDKLAFEIFSVQADFPFHVRQNGEYLGTIRVYHKKQLFAVIHLPNKITVTVVDTGNFIRGSLWKISRNLGLKHAKRKRPYFVNEGRSPNTIEEWQMLKEYCLDEIKAQYDLAEFILEKMHKPYDVPRSISTAHLSSYIFKKNFIKAPIQQIDLKSDETDFINEMENVDFNEFFVDTSRLPIFIVLASMYSYLSPLIQMNPKFYTPIGLAELCIHGGRASTFCPRLTPIPDVKMYDFNSFYPYAMTLLPPMTKGKWVAVDSFDDEHEGFYRISGYVKKCKYPVILKSYKTFEFANGEYVTNIAVVSYELREALRSKEIELNEISGYVWIPDENAENPFKDFAETFYERKANELQRNNGKETPLYRTYKLILNSLYGKTYQTIRESDFKEEPDSIVNPQTNIAYKNVNIRYRGGGLYLPHIGCWITSCCRAILHGYLHKYQALDCSTDSFKTFDTVETGDKLGELKLVCENSIPVNGMFLVFRPKLYVFFSKEVQNRVIQDYNGNLRLFLKENLSSLKIGKDILRYALHGFRGDVYDLLRLYQQKKNDYFFKHMTKIKESIRQHKQPRVMEKRKGKISMNWENQIGLCGSPIKKAFETKEMCTENCITCAHFREGEW